MWAIININRKNLPVSDECNYYVESKIFNYMDTNPKFDPLRCQNLVSMQEFSNIYSQILEKFENKHKTKIIK